MSVSAHSRVNQFTEKIIKLSKKRKLSGEDERISNHVKERIFDCTVDSHDFSESELIEMALEMLVHFDVFDALRTNISVVRTFMKSVRRLYVPENAFHNFKHVWAVMQSVFRILVMGAEVYFNKVDIFAVLVSALCHDLGHPGNNNDFEIATMSDISKTHTQRDGGVLECHHAALTQHLLTSPDHNVLGSMKKKDMNALLERIRYIIMGTDMGIHNQIEKDLDGFVADVVEYSRRMTSAAVSSSPMKKTASGREKIISKKVSTPTRRKGPEVASRASARIKDRKYANVVIVPPASLPNVEVRDLLLRAILHSADIGAQTGELPLAEKWMTRAYNEFHSQAQRENALRIYTSAFIHRASDELHKYISQCSFIEHVVEPLWKALKTIFPRLQSDYEHLLINKSAYQMRVEELMEEAKSLGETGSKRM